MKLFYALAPLLLALVSFWGCAPAQERVEIPTVIVNRGAVDVSLTVRGELEAVNSVKAVAPSGYGRLKITSLVEEGELVKKGDLLVSFDKQEIQDDLEELSDNYENSRADYLKTKTELAGRLADLKRGVKQAQLALERAQLGITDSEAVARIERERSRLEVEDAKLDLQKARQDLAAAQATGDSSLQAAETELTSLKRRGKRAREMLEKTEIFAPTDGLVILNSTWRGGRIAEGDEVWGGQTILELPDLSEMQVVAFVHEMDASQVEEGQRVEVVLDAYPDGTYLGKLKKKASIATTQSKDSKVKTFRVEVSLEETSEAMKPGMTTRCDFQIGRAEDVLPVPREAIVDTDDGPVVFIKLGKKTERRMVTLGVQSATHVAVEGIEPGTEVFLGNPQDTSAGGAS